MKHPINIVHGYVFDPAPDGVHEWSLAAHYEVGDLCYHDGAAWRAVAPSQGQAPTDGALWQRLQAPDLTGLTVASPAPGNPNIRRGP